MPFTEADYENAILELFQSNLGYSYQYGPDIDRDYTCPYYKDELVVSLSRLNRKLPQEAIDEAMTKLNDFELSSLVKKNQTFMDYLQNGIEVNFYDKGENKSDIVKLIDYKNIENNSFLVVNQWTFVEHSEKRADIVVFVNGLPLVIVELKSPSREETSIEMAYNQLRNYTKEIPSLFIYNAFLVISDMTFTKAGTITSGLDRFMEWKTDDGNYESTRFADYKVFFNGIFPKERFLDILRNFICFSNSQEKDIKILAGYHQYFAVKKAIISTQEATHTDGKGGVFWHTQGSGKSLSMVFYAKLLQEALSNPTIVVITDRNDLDNQLYSQFAKCSNFLRQTPVQATCRKLGDSSALKDIGLKDYLLGREANGIIFTTMQKFEESDEALSDRRNIIVMADEAHRGQYGLEEKIDKDGKIKIGAARVVRDNLPNATFIGFTGTPISTKDKNTREIFGDYIDIYDMTQVVEDGATRPVYYESRVINLRLDNDVLKQIDSEFDKLNDIVDEPQFEKNKKDLGRLDSILGADETITSLCEDIVSHYEKYRENLLTGKAMVVAYSRPIAIKMYKKILEIRPEWQDKIKIVMTGGNNDPEEWHDIVGNKTYREELATQFKDNNSPFKIAIVVDMWLTGFDVPSLATMYVYKPMSGHNLMQAIARVNRVYQDKEGGLVVDYIGIISAQKRAMNDFTKRDRANYGEQDISKAVIPKFIEKLEVCRDILYEFDYKKSLCGTDQQRLDIISDAGNYLLDPKMVSQKEDFLKEAYLLKQAQTLCLSLLNQEQRLESAFFEAVRILIVRATSGGKDVKAQNINERINLLLGQSVKSEGVINLFKEVKKEFSIFDPDFIEEISRMKQKNIAIEILKRLIAEQISNYKKTNLVKSEKFSEILSRSMNSYLNGMLTNEEVIEELKKIDEDIKKAKDECKDLGLTNEEMAFYDAITRPENIKDFYENDQLIAITKELTDMLRKNRTIDWQVKENSRAKMRKMVKRLLNKYHYPPEGMEDAIATVINQCQMWVDNL